MIVNFVPVDQVIRKIADDLGLGDRDIPWESMVDWIAHALQHIGAYAQYEKKCITLNIEDYKSPLPDDFHRVDSVLFHEPHKIEFSTIIVGFKEGELKLDYIAMPVDERGFPLVPEDPSFFDAMFWKVASMLAMRGELKNKEFTFEYCDRKWKYYCGQARASANMGDLQSINRIQNERSKLLPSMNQYWTQFRTLGHKQVLTRDGGLPKQF